MFIAFCRFDPMGGPSSVGRFSLRCPMYAQLDDVRGGVPLTFCGIRFSREAVAAFDPSVVTYGLVDVLGPHDVKPRVTRTDT